MTRILILIIFLAWPITAFTFESSEHKLVSDNAMKLTLEYFRQNRNVEINNDELAVLEAFVNGASELEGINYGEFTALADYQLDPYDLFKVWGNFNKLPTDLNGINTEYLKILKNKFTGNLRLAHTSHLNIDHFQEQLMFTYWWWHKIAVTVAVNDNNLLSALLINSFADHFLEDFFAPGHIQTPREDLHDVGALGIHDNYNKKGAKLKIKNWPELEDLLNIVNENNNFKQYTVAKIELLNMVKSENPAIDIYGDGYLGNNKTQELFMTLVVGRSIADVIESYKSKKVEPLAKVS